MKIENNTVILTNEEYTALINEFNALQHKYGDICDMYRLCKDENETIKQYAIMVRKETAREIICKLWHEKIETNVTISKYCSKEDAENIAKSIITSIRNTIKELAKQCGVEVEE